MNIFLKVVAGIIIAVVLTLVLSKQKDISLAITLSACCMAIVIAASYLQPVIQFWMQLQQMCNLDSDMLNILLKATGIGILSEITCLICEDSGQASLGKTLKILAGSIMLCISIPLFSTLLELINDILVSI